MLPLLRKVQPLQADMTFCHPNRRRKETPAQYKTILKKTADAIAHLPISELRSETEESLATLFQLARRAIQHRYGIVLNAAGGAFRSHAVQVHRQPPQPRPDTPRGRGSRMSAKRLYEAAQRYFADRATTERDRLDLALANAVEQVAVVKNAKLVVEVENGAIGLLLLDFSFSPSNS